MRGLQATSSTPQHLPQVALRQEGEHAGHDTGKAVGPLHRFLVSTVIAFSQIAECPPQAEKGDGDKQVDGCVPRDVG